jgi:hypothetical protein
MATSKRQLGERRASKFIALITYQTEVPIKWRYYFSIGPRIKVSLMGKAISDN